MAVFRGETTDISGGIQKVKDSRENWSEVGHYKNPANYDPHDPNTFTNPYEGIQSDWTPEQLQQHIDSGKFMYDKQWKQFDLWYNSESEKVKRLLAAGLNPDLLGLESASESSSEATPITDAGSKALQQHALDLQKSQMVADTLSNTASLLSGAASSLYELSLQQASVASSIELNRSTINKQDTEARYTSANISNLQSSLDTLTYDLALKSAMQDMSLGYTEGMTPDAISKLIRADGEYHTDKSINSSIIRHKRMMAGNIQYANKYLDSRNSASKNNITEAALGGYYIPSASTRATIRPLLSTAFDMYYTDMLFRTNHTKFMNQLINGISPDKVYKAINKEFDLRYDNAYYEKMYVKDRFTAIGEQYKADTLFNTDRYMYHKGRLDFGAPYQAGENSGNMEDLAAKSIEIEAKKQLMAMKSQKFLEELQDGYINMFQRYSVKLANGTETVGDAAAISYYNALYNDINSAVSAFESATQSSLFGNALGTAVGAATSIGTTLLMPGSSLNPFTR